MAGEVGSAPWERVMGAPSVIPFPVDDNCVSNANFEPRSTKTWTMTG